MLHPVFLISRIKTFNSISLYSQYKILFMDIHLRPVILFDGVCNLCNSAVQFILKRDKRAKFLLGSLQSESGQALLIKHDLPIDDYASFVYIKEGKVYTKSSGALHVLKDLGGLWKLFFVFILIPMPIRDYAYSLIANNRYRIFGKKNECIIPSDGVKSRFLP